MAFTLGNAKWRRGLAISMAALTLAGCSKPSETVGSSSGGSATPNAKVGVLLAELPPAYAHADLHNGELHFHLCLACHTIDKGGPDMTGPNLYGVFGRAVASRPDFAYSAALRSKHWVWDVSHLDGWLKNPRDYVPGTIMTFYGLRNDEDRLDTIAYLKVVSQDGTP
jgi:cytochrome c